MSYSVNVSGHHDGMNADDQRAAEYGVARKLHEAIKDLPSVDVASFGGQHYVHGDLRTEPQPPVGSDADTVSAEDIA